MTESYTAEVGTAASDTADIDGLILDLSAGVGCPAISCQEDTPTPSEQEPLVVLHQASQTYSVNE